MRGRREIARGACTLAALVTGAALAACFPGFAVGAGDAGAAAAGGRDAGMDASADATTDAPGDSKGDASPDAPADSSADSSVTDASDGGGALPSVPFCGDMSGLQPNAPWPMHGYCPTQRRRGPLPGPGTTRPTVEWHAMPQLDGSALPVDADFAPLVTANGLVLTVATDSSTSGMGSAMSAYDAMTGALEWTWSPPPQTPPDLIEWSPAVGADDVIYVPCNELVYGVGLDGKQLWQSQAQNSTRSPIIVGPGPVLYVDDPTSGLWSLLANGSDNWTVQLDAAVDYQTPVFGVPDAGLTIFQTTTDGTLWTVTPSGGAPRFLWGPGDDAGPPITMHAAIAPDGKLRFTNETDDRLWSVAPSGAEAWAWPPLDAGATGMPHVPAIGDDSTVYVARADGDVYAIDATGHVKWSTSDQPLCNAITLDANGALYTGCQDGLHAYDPAGGNRLWAVTTPFASGLSYGIAIGRSAWLYVNASDGTLYALAP